MGIAPSEGIARWEGFELDIRTAELRRANGKVVRLSEQPLRILVALLERPGEMVTREELRKRLWPNDTAVEFEHGISAAMNRLRQALGDSAENPKFIETLARRGYRWKTPVTWEQPQAAPPPAPPSDGNFTGKRVGHYRVLEILGGGGMGVVYKAEDIKLGRHVALKFLPEELAGDAAAMQRFEREARAASALDHPNICSIYEFGEHERQHFLAMQFLKGQTLREKIETDGPLPISQVLKIAIQIAAGLEAAHKQGILHRDIKPANIFLTDSDAVKLLDFGLAKSIANVETLEVRAADDKVAVAGESSSLTQTGTTVGTAAYMSPEQVRGETLDARTDLFSFGLVMYEMATGQRAFAGDTAPALHDAILHRTPAPVRDLNPQIPAKLEAAINKAMEKDRAARYQSAAEIRADLELLQVDKERRRPRWWLAAAATVTTVTLLAAASFWFAIQQRQSLPPAPELKLRQLTANSPENRVQDGRISPDGKYLAYVDLKGIHIKTVDTDEVRTLAQPEALKSQKREWAFGAWSPDSTRLILNAHPTAGAEYLNDVEADEDLSIWEFPLHGGKPQLLRKRAWADAISPDGSWISFRANRSNSGSREIWIMNSRGDHAQKLFEDAEGGLIWSPDGRHIWYLRSNGPEPRDADFKLFSFPWEKDRIRAGSTATDVTPSFGMEDANDISALPDGRLIVSVRDAGTIGSRACNFWIVQLDPKTGKPSGKPRQLTRWTGFCMSDTSVTADGKRLAFLQWSGHPALYVADLHAGGTRITNGRHFTGNESTELWADWTRDSETLIFLSSRSGRPGIYKQALDSDTPELLVSPQNDLATCCVSPDGEWLIYRIHDQVMRVHVTGGPAENVFPVKRLNWWDCAAASSNLCAIAETTEDRKQAIVTAFDPLNGRGSELTRIAIEPNMDWALALSPDGKRLAVIRGPGNPLQILSLHGDVLQEIKMPEWRAAGPIEWAADGKGLFVPSLAPGGASLLYVSLQGEVHIIRENRGGNYSPGLPSPDGRHIAIVGTATNSNMWLMENF